MFWVNRCAARSISLKVLFGTWQAQVHSPRPTKGASFGLWQRKIIELKSAKRYRCYRWCVSSKRRVEHRTCKYICWWSCFNNFAQMSYNHRPLVANNIKFPTWRSYDSAFRNGGYPPIHLSCQGFQNPFPKKTSNSHNLQNILHHMNTCTVKVSTNSHTLTNQL